MNLGAFPSGRHVGGGENCCPPERLNSLLHQLSGKMTHAQKKRDRRESRVQTLTK